MNATLVWRGLADLVLALHLLVVVFVVGGLVLIVIGHGRGWRWVDAVWFRVAHLLAIVFVAVQSWLGAVCPLTRLESWLRVRGQALPYETGFIQHWFQRVLYHEAPSWVFTVSYTLFGLAVAAAWWYFPPRFRSGAPSDEPDRPRNRGRR